MKHGRTKRFLLLAILLLGLQAVMKGCSTQRAEQQHTLKESFVQEAALEMRDALYSCLLPLASFLQEENGGTHWILQEQIDSLLPFYGYCRKYTDFEEGKTDSVMGIREVMLAEAEEGILNEDALKPFKEESGTEIKTGTEIGRTEGTAEEAGAETGIGTENEAKEAAAASGTDGFSGQTLEELLQAETEAALQSGQYVTQQQTFLPHSQQCQIPLQQLQNYEDLVETFYTIDKNTMAGSDQLDAEKLLAMDMTMTQNGEEPQILIYHTHSQEAFADSVQGDASTSIVGVGEHLAKILRERYGYQVIHHTAQYDTVRDEAYSVALPEIEELLEENPSIQVVIDLHRDSVAEETRLVMNLDGRPTARFMFFNGLSRTKKTGNIAYLYNENQEENLAFSFQMQLKAAEYYPGLTRKIYLKGYRYNMHLRPKYLLVELGAQNNTLEEAKNACEPLAHVLSMVLSGQ